MADNAGPRFSPVVISEVMPEVSSAGGGMAGEAFVELYNATDQPVALFEAVQATDAPDANTDSFPWLTHATARGWRLSGSIKIQLPTDLTLPARGCLLVVGFDPATEPGRLAEFQARHGPANAAWFIGPYHGELNRRDGRIVLEKPLPTVDALAPAAYVVMDQVRYWDAAPWPTADLDAGGSLQRRGPDLYGNDPVAWEAGAPTPMGLRSLRFTVPLQDTFARPPADAILRVETIGLEPLLHEWHLNGLRIPEATNRSLTVANPSAADEGDYTVVVRDAAGWAISSSAKLELWAAPVMIQPVPPVRIEAFEGEDVILGVHCTGTLPIEARWRRVGASGARTLYELDSTNRARTFTITLANATPDHAGIYLLALRNPAGGGWTPAHLVTNAFVTVSPAPPFFVVEPTNQIAHPGATMSFVSEARGTGPISYQWYFNGATPIAQATNATLVLSDVQPANAGTYSVLASNHLGIVVSRTAVLTVAVPDADMDGMSDAWELAHRLDPFNPADRDLDLDGDGRSNWEESRSGTDPRDPASVLQVGVAYGENGSVVIEVSARPGIAYAVLRCDQLASGAWQVLSNIEPQSVSVVIRVTDAEPRETGSRFYRVAAW